MYIINHFLNKIILIFNALIIFYNKYQAIYIKELI